MDVTPEQPNAGHAVEMTDGVPERSPAELRAVIARDIELHSTLIQEANRATWFLRSALFCAVLLAALLALQSWGDYVIGRTATVVAVAALAALVAWSCLLSVKRRQKRGAAYEVSGDIIRNRRANGECIME